MKLNKEEKRFARAAGISVADLHRTGGNSCGTVWAIYNPYCLCEATYNGYTRREIYRDLLRRLIAKAGCVAR